MLVSQCGDSFQFDDNFLKADVIWLVSLLQYPTTIAEGERWFSDCRNPLVFKFDAQALLINWFQKSTTLLVVHLKARANNRVALLLMYDFWHFVRVYSRDSRAKNTSSILRWLLAAPAQKQFRPFLPETCPCGQIDASLASHQPERLPRNRTECRLIDKKRSATSIE